MGEISQIVVKLHKAQPSVVCHPRYSEWNVSHLLLPVLSQISTTVYFVKVKITDFHICFHAELWLLSAFLTRARHAIEFEKRSGPNIF